MKTINYCCLLIFLLIFNACKKDKSVTKEVNFTSTTYKTLGTYSSLGKPDYLLTPDIITENLLSYIENNLPDGQDLRLTHPELFSSTAVADIKITQSSDVFVTFVSGVAGYSNSIAFYTYRTGIYPATVKDIPIMTYIFPSAGHLTPLQAGDKVKIGRFEPGTSIGFVLLQQGWDSTRHVLDNNVVHFLSTDALNPEVDPALKRHAILLNYAPENKILIGFEDRDRTTPNCDNDFNDVVFYCTVTP